MMLDEAFEPTGAAGKAQALTDRNDPNTIPAKASPEDLIMRFLSPCFAVPTTALGLLSSTNWKFIDRATAVSRRSVFLRKCLRASPTTASI
jgi:hypothetical protein